MEYEWFLCADRGHQSPSVDQPPRSTTSHCRCLQDFMWSRVGPVRRQFAAASKCTELLCHTGGPAGASRLKPVGNDSVLPLYIGCAGTISASRSLPAQLPLLPLGCRLRRQWPGVWPVTRRLTVPMRSSRLHRKNQHLISNRPRVGAGCNQ